MNRKAGILLTLIIAVSATVAIPQASAKGKKQKNNKAAVAAEKQKQQVKEQRKNEQQKKKLALLKRYDFNKDGTLSAPERKRMEACEKQLREMDKRNARRRADLIARQNLMNKQLQARIVSEKAPKKTSRKQKAQKKGAKPQPSSKNKKPEVKKPQSKNQQFLVRYNKLSTTEQKQVADFLRKLEQPPAKKAKKGKKK